MKTTIEPTEVRNVFIAQGITRLPGKQRVPDKLSARLFSPVVMLIAMATAILLLDAILPLHDLWFHDALLTELGSWPALPSLLLFNGWALVPSLPLQPAIPALTVLIGWTTPVMLFASFSLIFLIYLLALRHLPVSISQSFILRSTIVIGCLYLLIPVVTSPDLFSYIAYARMGILHNLNPLTTVPNAIQSDPIYQYVFWVNQPSAYGPTWAVITSLIQGLFAVSGNTDILPMVIALRLVGLLSHLISTLLVWSISGQLQRLNGQPEHATRKRIRATLAFAWNPLLLFEACVNAHNDALLLVFVLLAIWVLARDKIGKMQLDESTASRDFDLVQHVKGSDVTAIPVLVARTFSVALIIPLALVRIFAEALKRLNLPMKNAMERIPLDLRAPMAAACLLALGTCLKINAVVLFPGFLFYIWLQAPTKRIIKHTAVTLITYAAVILLFYAPFWQGGAIYYVLQVNPATYRSINTLAQFLTNGINSIGYLFGFSMHASNGSPVERILHTISMGIFAVLYLVLLWRMVRAMRRMRSPRALIYWLAVSWLLYCAIGSPWYWPWYIVTFLGLFALLEASKEDTPDENRGPIFPWRLSFMRTPWLARLLSFSMLTMYCFLAGPMHSYVPGLPAFQWMDLTGVWGWIVPIIGLALLVRFKPWDLVEPPKEQRERLSPPW